MFKFICLMVSLLACFAIQAKTNSEPFLTPQDLSDLSLQDQRLVKASFPEFIKEDATKGTAVVATIGPPGCNFNANVWAAPIQGAIDWAGLTYTELRIVEGVYTEENITLDDRDMVIKGGYATCADAANDVMSSPDSLNTIIQSSAGNNPVFNIKGSNSHNSIAMYNLTIQNSGSSIWFGGAIRINDADASVSLNNMALRNNIGLKGGAIGVTGTQGEPLVTLNSVRVSNNSAEEGGGVFCRHPAASVVQNVSSGETHGIYSNAASAGDGGGVLVENGCKFTSYQGSQNVFLFGDDKRGINFNTATGNGGGIAIRSGAKAFLVGRSSCFPFFGGYLCIFGNNTEPVSLVFNKSDSDDNNTGNGGGIFVTGLGSALKAENALIRSNLAKNGAGVSVEDTATALIKATYENQAGPIGCWQPGACLDFNGNLATTFGGAFYVNSGAELNVVNTNVRSQRASKGLAGYVNGTNSKLNIEGGFVHSNGQNGNGSAYDDEHVFRTWGSNELNLAFVTVADNRQVGQVIANDSSSVTVGSSIIHDDRASAPDIYYQSGTNPNSSFDCLIGHENITIGNAIQVADPKFVNRAGNDFHLAGDSPAIDYCDTMNTQANYKDMDGEERGWDDPTKADFYGPYDIGGDESYINDIIFKDDFE